MWAHRGMQKGVPCKGCRGVREAQAQPQRRRGRQRGAGRQPASLQIPAVEEGKRMPEEGHFLPTAAGHANLLKGGT